MSLEALNIKTSSGRCQVVAEHNARVIPQPHEKKELKDGCYAISCQNLYAGLGIATVATQVKGKRNAVHRSAEFVQGRRRMKKCGEPTIPSVRSVTNDMAAIISKVSGTGTEIGKQNGLMDGLRAIESLCDGEKVSPLMHTKIVNWRCTGFQTVTKVTEEPESFLLVLVENRGSNEDPESILAMIEKELGSPSHPHEVDDKRHCHKCKAKTVQQFWYVLGKTSEYFAVHLKLGTRTSQPEEVTPGGPSSALSLAPPKLTWKQIAENKPPEPVPRSVKIQSSIVNPLSFKLGKGNERRLLTRAGYVAHEGTLKSGHYTAVMDLSPNLGKPKWYLFDSIEVCRKYDNGDKSFRPTLLQDWQTWAQSPCYVVYRVEPCLNLS